MENKSEFTGGLLGLIGVSLLAAFLSVITLGICYPWGVCLKQKWIAKHTVIDGQRLYFDGKAGQLFGNYIKWFVFTVITLGIYGFWLNIKMKKWVTKHTHQLR